MKYFYNYYRNEGETLNNLRNIFSKNLKYYRIKENLRQEDLAEKVELTDKYISDLERAKFSPSLETIEKIASVLNIDAYILLKKNDNNTNITRIDEKTGTRKRKY